MKTAAEIAAELGQAAERMREVQKAAKDQAARQTAEPPDGPRTIPGLVSPAQMPTVPVR
tara:strand:+ start:587 stop:763 length:177 start_codon:yes stop_codon:yes gene_type:complete